MKEEQPQKEGDEKEEKPWVYIDLNTQEVFLDFFGTISPTEDLVPLTWENFLKALQREK